MKTASSKVYEVVEPIVAGMGYELLGIEWVAQGKHSMLRVYIDHADGIRLQDCSAVSHQLSGVLDVEDVLSGHYQLEVSSPGLDRPLFTLEQFVRHVGEQVKLHCVVPVNGQRKFNGSIAAVEDECVIVEVKGERYKLPFMNISRANLVPNI